MLPFYPKIPVAAFIVLFGLWLGSLFLELSQDQFPNEEFQARQRIRVIKMELRR